MFVYTHGLWVRNEQPPAPPGDLGASPLGDSCNPAASGVSQQLVPSVIRCLSPMSHFQNSLQTFNLLISNIKSNYKNNQSLPPVEAWSSISRQDIYTGEDPICIFKLKTTFQGLFPQTKVFLILVTCPSLSCWCPIWDGWNQDKKIAVFLMSPVHTRWTLSLTSIVTSGQLGRSRENTPHQQSRLFINK